MLSVEKDIGAHLQQARESMGLSLDQLQEKTKIQKSFIIAIENGEFDKLPSPFYVRTYLRTYCKCVKLEPHHILRQYRKSEQAERGLTNVHQAITPEMLAQTQQLYQNDVNSQNTGHNMMNSQILHNGAPQTRVSRTQTHTALTIAKTNPKAKQNTGVPQPESVRQTTNPAFEQKRIKNSTLEQKRTKSSFEHTRLNMKDQIRKKNNPTPILEDTQLTPRRATKSATSNQFATGLSRSTSSKESTNPPIIERSSSSSPLSSDVSKQEISQMRQLSRSAVRSRRSTRGFQFRFPNKKSALIIIASVAICIPLVWATVAAIAGDDEPSEQNSVQTNANGNDQEPSETLTTPETTQSDSEEPTEENIVLTNSSSGENTYEVSGSDNLHIQFRASDQSWIQVRNQRAPQKQGYLNDATLQSGHEDQYKHSFADGEEIWISLGIPDVVEVTVNGKPIKSAKIIHLKKK